MRKKKDRDIAVFSLSFLDCISCGFGAIILLFVISLGSERLVLVQIRDTLMKIFQARMAEFTEIQKQKEELTLRFTDLETAITIKEDELEKKENELDNLSNQINEAEYGKESMVAKLEELGEEIDAREQLVDIEQRNETPLPVGVPVESNHIIFILDTSGSMRNPGSGLIRRYVTQKIAEVLDAYPIVKGIQFLDADGRYVLDGSAGRWLPDSLSTRRQFLTLIQRYDHHSESNPVPGIIRAIRTFSDPDDAEKKVGIYIFGDEFTETAEKVLDRIDKLNPRGDNGKRPVTINAVGFPHVVKFERHLTRTGLKFANLMRELTNAHDGAFIGVED